MLIAREENDALDALLEKIDFAKGGAANGADSDRAVLVKCLVNRLDGLANQ